MWQPGEPPVSRRCALLRQAARLARKEDAERAADSCRLALRAYERMYTPWGILHTYVGLAFAALGRQDPEATGRYREEA